MGYEGLQGITEIRKGYKRLQGVTKGYWGYKTRQDNAIFGVLYSPMYMDFIQII